jgi:hypothetical protein
MIEVADVLLGLLLEPSVVISLAKSAKKREEGIQKKEQ